ncbi:MAG: Gfo/Idh/MocA family oxidoreductase [Pirellulales bacterium]|nr:Gfo/Idh/MocA family oxidoreductase [Planctomycetales bacterium]
MSHRTDRRSFLATAAGVAAATTVPYYFTADAEARARAKSPNDRFRIGAIGLKYQGSVITRKAVEHGDVVAICDVDRDIAEQAREEFGGKADIYNDHRRMLDRDDIDVVMIGTPDHWHTAMLVDACRSGRDVYCEKPLTLTIDEGKLIRQVVGETGRVVQVGTWQRSDSRFRLACELVRQGRIGRLESVDVVLGKNKTGGPFAVQDVPANLDWERWQGQTPAVPYIPERCHYTFRWWYEYSGGQMTDWGAHHIDIAQWGIAADPVAPIEVHTTADFPNVADGYNVAINYSAEYKYPGDVTVSVKDHGRTGVMFNGSEGRLFVNRGTVSGKPVEDLAQDPLERDHYTLYAHDNLDRPPRAGKLDAIINHMGNFFDCVRNRETPISDVESQHRSVSTCHMGNISMRLGRSLRWDPEAEQFIGDDEANRWLSRPQRAGYEIS